MYTLIVIIVLVILAIVLRTVYVLFRDRINFFITGLDSGFGLPDLLLLWNVAAICNLEDPTSLFYSLPSLSKCMTMITNQSMAEGEQHSPKTQKLLTKLFDFRTKLQNQSDSKKGISDTRGLVKGQPLRIILPGQGVFSSTIINNGSAIAISVPKQKGLISIPAEDWVNKVISVYFWRKEDARYVFDTTVIKNGLFVGESALFLKHTGNLVRTQKRRAVRVQCELPGNLFIVKNKNVDSSAIETRNGYKCLIKDISESGALIKIGGKGAQNIKIKLQFLLNNKLILMFGIVRTVEFNENKNQSLLHFECTHIEPIMRNEVLSFVYNTIPDSQKEVLEALEQTELDSQDDGPENNSKEKTPGESLDDQVQKMAEESEKRINSIVEVAVKDKTAESNNQEKNIDPSTLTVTKAPVDDFSEDDIEELEEV